MKKQAITFLLILAGFLTSFAQSYPEMVKVKGGIFAMGCTSELVIDCKKDELPKHLVSLSTYSIGKYPVTVEQYKIYCTATGASMPEEPSWGWIDNHPIVGVTHFDATAYCNWLSEKFGGNWHLPTEGEWEYAARGGKKTKYYTYSGSNDIDEVSWFVDNAGSKTQAVGRKKANELGIYDMSGNVWEWCKDWYGTYTTPDFYHYDLEIDPQGAATGARRVLRGGSFYDSAKNSRVSSRFGITPSGSYGNFGFRVVLSQ